MFFALSILFVSIFLLDLKVIIRAVIIKDADIDQALQDGFEVVLEFIPAAGPAADRAKTKTIINGLLEKVSVFIKFLTAVIHLPVSME